VQLFIRQRSLQEQLKCSHITKIYGLVTEIKSATQEFKQRNILLSSTILQILHFVSRIHAPLNYSLKFEYIDEPLFSSEARVFDRHIGFAVKSETFARVIHKYTSV